MAINKVVYGEDTLVDLTEDTVTAEDVLNSKSFHTPDGVKRTGTASYPVTDVQVNGESVLDGTVAKVEQPTAEVKTATDQFTTADGGLLSKCMIDLVPVQSGSGDPSPDNVRPISGHTEVDLQTAGKNLLRVTASSTTPYTVNDDGTILANGTSYGVNLIVGYVYPNGSTQYKLNGCPSGGGPSTYRLDARLVSTNAIITGSEDYGNGSTFTASEPFYIALRSPNAVVMSNVLFKPMVRLATESDSTYEPYLGNLYKVQIGSTVYGGTLNVITGELVVDRKYLEYDGSSDENWSINTQGTPFFAIGVNSLPSGSELVCNEFKYTGIYTGNTDIGVYSAALQLRVRPNLTFTDVTAFKTWLSSNPLSVVAYTNAPQTIQLTPQQIETLVGQNNLSTPLSGQSIETNGVEYKELFTFADVKEYVDKKIPDAPTTDGTYTLQAVVSSGVPTYSWV